MSTQIVILSHRQEHRAQFNHDALGALIAACYREVAHRMQDTNNNQLATRRLAWFALDLEEHLDGADELPDDVEQTREMVYRIYGFTEGDT
jgi:hypothetical protein